MGVEDNMIALGHIKVQNILDGSATLKDVLYTLNVKDNGGNRKKLKEYIATNALSMDMLNTTRKFKREHGSFSANKRGYSDIFRKESDVTPSVVRNRVITDNLLSYECEHCGNTGEWMGHPVTLTLIHRNDDNTDHRLTNLTFLCPNCHSQGYQASRNAPWHHQAVVF